MSIAWSYSSLKTFEQCPRKYYHLKVAKDIKDGDTEIGVFDHETFEAWVSNFFIDRYTNLEGDVYKAILQKFGHEPNVVMFE